MSSILSLDASQSMKLTLMKDVSHCFIRSDKLGRRRDELVVFHDAPEGYALAYTDWLRLIHQVSGGHILFGFTRRVKAYFDGRTREQFQQELTDRGIPFRRECPREEK